MQNMHMHTVFTYLTNNQMLVNGNHFEIVGVVKRKEKIQYIPTCLPAFVYKIE